MPAAQIEEVPDHDLAYQSLRDRKSDCFNTAGPPTTLKLSSHRLDCGKIKDKTIAFSKAFKLKICRTCR